MTFTKIHERGYSVSVEGPGINSSTMNPAPGYDDRLPHDVAHFIVEQDLGIMGGVFGQLASGGAFRVMHSTDAKKIRKVKKRRTELARVHKHDALFAEHAIYAAQARWEHQEIIPDTKIPAEVIDRLCRKFDEFADRWTRMAVGESISFEWEHRKEATGRR